MTNTFNYTNLDYLRLMSDGDKEMEKTMLEMLIAELPEELEKIKSLYHSENWEDLGNVSHKMKSTLAFVGNEEMTNANKEIEQLAKSRLDTAHIETLLALIEKDFPKVMQELERTLAEM